MELTRRTALRASALPMAAGMPAIAFAQGAAEGVADFAGSFPHRAAIAALAAQDGRAALLAQTGPAGLFVFSREDRRALVSADPLQGLSIAPAADPTGASGAWIRVWDGINAIPEWFFAGDWADAIEACYRLCPVTQLGRKDYLVSRTIRLNTPWRTIRGQGGVAYDGNQGTRIVYPSGSGDIMHLGPDSYPGGNPGVTFLRGVELRHFQLTRGAPLVPERSIPESPSGIRCRYLFDCDVAIYAYENSVGMQVKGCVSSRLACYAERALPATTTANDVAVGIFIDGTEDIGLAAGNASITVRGQTNMAARGAGIRTGIFAYGKLADLTLDQCETVSGTVALHLKAVGTALNNVDIRIIAPTLDQPGTTGLLIEDFPPGAQVDIISPYVGASSTAAHAVDIRNSHADINIIAGHLIATGGAETIGLHCLNSANVNVLGTALLDFPAPVLLDGSRRCDMKPNISNPNTTARAFAIGLSGDCSGCVIDPKISGRDDAFPAAGVVSYADATRDLRIGAERIEQSACAGGRKVMLGARNIAVTASGRYNGTGAADAAGTITVTGLPAAEAERGSGARQAAIPDDESASANQATVNAILAALRQHGVIAP